MAVSKMTTLLSGLILFTPLASMATTCPPLNEIMRTPGEYSWSTTTAGWEAQYATPRNGRGFSNTLDHFIEARFMQLNNLPNSPGYMQCFYQGDVEGEIVSLTQIDYSAVHKPTMMNWVAQNNNYYPSVQAVCTVSIEQCIFEDYNS